MVNVLSGVGDRPWCSGVFAEGFALQSTDLSTALSSGQSTPLTWLLLPPAQASGKRAGNKASPRVHLSPAEPPPAQSHSCSQVLLCQADLPSVVPTGLYSNESKTGSSFQGCLYAKEGVKA